MKQRNQKKQTQKQKKILSQTQIIKRMEEQQKQGRYVNFVLHGISFAKIPIIRFTPEINQFLSKYKDQTNVCFMKCELISLDNLSVDGSKVESVRINYNYLKGDSIKIISKLFPKLRYLNLRHNLISDLDDLKDLKELKELEHLDLNFNPVRNYRDYKKIIFQCVPQLQNLDDDIEIDDSDDNSSRENWISREQSDEGSIASSHQDSDFSNDDNDIKQKRKRKKIKK